ncbi:hypothetical protein ACFLW0_02555 [Chloroflexota bacterium]
MDKGKEINNESNPFGCELCRAFFPTKWQLERHNRTEAHQRVVRVSLQSNNNVVVAPKVDLSLPQRAPLTTTPIVFTESTVAHPSQIRMSPRKILLYGTLIVIVLSILDNLGTRRDGNMTHVKLGTMDLAIPDSLAALLSYLGLSKMTRAEIKGWLDIGQGINKFFSNWSKN